MTDNVPNLVHLNARNTTYAVVSRHEVEEQQALQRRFGWKLDWYSAAHNSFTDEVDPPQRRVRRGQPFTAVSVMPSIRRRCARKKITTTGSTTSSE